MSLKSLAEKRFDREPDEIFGIFLQILLLQTSHRFLSNRNQTSAERFSEERILKNIKQKGKVLTHRCKGTPKRSKGAGPLLVKFPITSEQN